jgi:hypothetical protein
MYFRVDGFFMRLRVPIDNCDISALMRVTLQYGKKPFRYMSDCTEALKEVESAYMADTIKL